MEEVVTKAFGGRQTVEAVLFELGEDGNGASGAVLIENLWFGIQRSDGKLLIVPDDRKLFEVWAGNALSLVPAVRYVETDPFAEFPVTCDGTWTGEQALGTIKGPAGAGIELDLGGGIGRCLLVVCPAGDRLYRIGDGKAADITSKLGLTTASNRAAVGDFTGDGLLDLALERDGAIVVVPQQAGGAFAPPRPLAKVKGCLSMACIAVAGEGGKRVAGARARYRRPARDSSCRTADGAWQFGEPLAAPGDLGQGGYCLCRRCHRRRPW